MICQNCHEHEATVVITKIVGEQHSITHLCKVCANELGGASGVSMSIQMLTAEPVSTDVCDTCGKSYADFKKSGLFGCADCYAQFEKHLPRLFKRVQGMTQHVITEPEAAIDDLASLEEELSEAVSSENFEKAASIRDRLVALRAPGSSAT